MADITSLMAGYQAPNIQPKAAFDAYQQGQQAATALWEQRAKQAVQDAVKQSTDANGNFDPNRYSQISAMSPYAGILEQYGRQMVTDRAKNAADIANAYTQMGLYGVSGAGMYPEVDKATWASQSLNAPINAPLKGAQVQQPDTTGFTTPDMDKGGMGGTGYELTKAVAQQEGTGTQGSAAGMQPSAPPDISQPPLADTVAAGKGPSQTWLGSAAGMQPDPLYMLNALKTRAGLRDVTEDDVGEMNGEAVKERVTALQLKGLLPTKPSNAQIAAAMNQDAMNQFMAKIGGVMDFSNPLKTAGGIAGAAMGAGQTGSETAEAESTGGRGAESQRLGIASSEFGLKKAKTEFGQEQNPIQDVASRGGDLANASNIARIKELEGKITALHRSAEVSQQLVDDPKRLAAMSDDDVNTLRTTALQAINSSENANTEGAQHALGSLFRSAKANGQIVQGSDGLLSFAGNWAKSNLSAQDRKEMFRLIASAANNLVTEGQSRSEYDGFSRSKHIRMPWESSNSLSAPLSAPVKGKAKTQKLKRATSGDL